MIVRNWKQAALVASLTLGAGCQSTKYVDSKSNETIVSVGEINIQDYGSAAEKMVNSLISSGVLGAQGSPRKVMMVSTVKNSTMQHIDTELLTKKIRVALNKSGRVITTTAVKAGGAEDTASMDTRELRNSEEFNKATVAEKGQMVAPDYSLSGKIIQTNASAGKTKESTYTFQLSFTNVKTGLAEWEEEVEITKQGNKPTVGW